MRAMLFFVPLGAVMTLACSGGDSSSGSLVGSWQLVSFEVGGEPYSFERALTLDVSDDGYRASTTCNSISGRQIGESPFDVTQMLCGQSGVDENLDPMVGEDYMTQVLKTEPDREGDELVFADDRVRLVYKMITDQG